MSLAFVSTPRQYGSPSEIALTEISFGAAAILRGQRLEYFRFFSNRENAPGRCIIAFTSREPVSTSLENALDSIQMRVGGASGS
jgi:hypothetical protein